MKTPVGFGRMSSQAGSAGAPASARELQSHRKHRPSGMQSDAMRTVKRTAIVVAATFALLAVGAIYMLYGWPRPPDTTDPAVFAGDGATRCSRRWQRPTWPSAASQPTAPRRQIGPSGRITSGASTPACGRAATGSAGPRPGRCATGGQDRRTRSAKSSSARHRRRPRRWWTRCIRASRSTFKQPAKAKCMKRIRGAFALRCGSWRSWSTWPRAAAPRRLLSSPAPNRCSVVYSATRRRPTLDVGTSRIVRVNR